ncbi:MAG: hypothetical protein ACRECO_13700 [Xanthobacteraceae bacterium]
MGFAPPDHASAARLARLRHAAGTKMKNDHCICTVEVSPDEVDAGADITLKVRLDCSHEGGLKKPSISIRNPEDAELASAKLAKSEGEAYETNDIVLAAPRVTGEHVYRAVLVVADKDGASHEQTSTEFRFVVKPHTALLNVWDVPSTIVAGERFKFTVGVKCSAGCDLAGQALNIVDRQGAQVGAANLGHDVWPGTDALYFAEIEAEAPLTAGNHEWGVNTVAWSSELPHAAGSFAMAVRVVSPPDCEVTVEAVDRDKQIPIKGARVVMHPYRGLTDKNGIAKLKVSKGQYDVLISGSKYVPVSIAVEVTADMVTKAELDVDPPWTPPDEVAD